MQYMILIYGPEYPTPEPGQPGFEEIMAPWLEYNQKLVDAGAFVSAGQLQPVSTATTVRREFGGGDTLIDGPFAETKEVLGGFYLIEAPDLDAAIGFAQAIPMPAGSIEVRPLGYNPQ